jgi:transaldolase/glucose-6-phosphate isomerase
MLNKTTFSFGNEIKESFEAAAKEFGSNGVVQRIWDKDATVWTNSGEDKWLGWLDIVNREKREQSKYIKFVQEVKETGYEAIVLLGMGGSSLCPEVKRLISLFLIRRSPLKLKRSLISLMLQTHCL